MYLNSGIHGILSIQPMADSESCSFDIYVCMYAFTINLKKLFTMLQYFAIGQTWTRKKYGDQIEVKSPFWKLSMTVRIEARQLKKQPDI